LVNQNSYANICQITADLCCLLQNYEITKVNFAERHKQNMLLIHQKNQTENPFVNRLELQARSVIR